MYGSFLEISSFATSKRTDAVWQTLLETIVQYLMGCLTTVRFLPAGQWVRIDMSMI
jgi:hypothetical protein